MDPITMGLTLLLPLWKMGVEGIGVALRNEFAQWEFQRQILWSGLFVLGAIAAIVPAKFYEVLLRRFFHWKKRLSEATMAVFIEAEKTEKLLRNVVPVVFVEPLKTKASDFFSSSAVSSSSSSSTMMKQKSKSLSNLGFAHHFDNSLVMLQSDFVEFTRFSSLHDSRELIAILNAFFLRFDDLILKSGLEKTKTAGDSIMAVDLASEREMDSDECVELNSILCGLAMQKATAEINSGLRMDLQMRVGVVRSEGVVGVIGGHRSLTFDVFGPCTHEVTELEASCVPGCVHVGFPHTWDLPARFSSFLEIVDVPGSLGVMVKGFSDSMLDGYGEHRHNLSVVDLQTNAGDLGFSKSFSDSFSCEDLEKGKRVGEEEADSAEPLTVPNPNSATPKRFQIHPVFCVYRNCRDNLDSICNASKDLRVMTLWQSVLATLTYLAFNCVLVVTDAEYYSSPTFVIQCVVSALSMIATVTVVAAANCVQHHGPTVKVILVVVSVVNGPFLAWLTLFSVLFRPAIELSGVDMRNFAVILSVYLHFSFLWIPWIVKAALAAVSVIAFVAGRTILVGLSLQMCGYAAAMVVVQVFKFYGIHHMILQNHAIGEGTRAQWETAQRKSAANDLLLESFLPKFVIQRLKAWDEEGDTDDDDDDSLRSFQTQATRRFAMQLERLFPRISEEVHDGCCCFVKIGIKEGKVGVIRLVEILMVLYRQFDEILAEAPSAIKIKSLNTTYLFISRQVESHGGGEEEYYSPRRRRMDIVDAAIAMRERFVKEAARSGGGVALPCMTFRAGLHAGSFHQGIVGSSKYALDVFGDTINVSARLAQMKDQSVNATIECSASFLGVDSKRKDIRPFYDYGERREVSLKGKGSYLAFRMRSRLEDSDVGSEEGV